MSATNLIHHRREIRFIIRDDSSHSDSQRTNNRKEFAGKIYEDKKYPSNQLTIFFERKNPNLDR